MATFGFESNEDYEYRIRCLLNYPTEGLRCLNVVGDTSRRQTAFANALALALEYPHITYHDFSQHENPVVAESKEHGDEQTQDNTPALSRFDRAMIESSAFSEAEKSILIIDQLQLADFKHHIQLYQMVMSRCWVHGTTEFEANPDHFLLVLISEQPLYHSLDKVSFRIWTDPQQGRLNYQPSEFDLDARVIPIFDTIANLFEQLNTTPTRSEFEKILYYLLRDVRTENQLCQVIYGWTESLNHNDLNAPPTRPALTAVIQAVRDYIGMDQISL